MGPANALRSSKLSTSPTADTSEVCSILLDQVLIEGSRGDQGVVDPEPEGNDLQCANADGDECHLGSLRGHHPDCETPR